MTLNCKNSKSDNIVIDLTDKIKQSVLRKNTEEKKDSSVKLSRSLYAFVKENMRNIN